MGFTKGSKSKNITKCIHFQSFLCSKELQSLLMRLNKKITDRYI